MKKKKSTDKLINTVLNRRDMFFRKILIRCLENLIILFTNFKQQQNKKNILVQWIPLTSQFLVPNQ